MSSGARVADAVWATAHRGAVKVGAKRLLVLGCALNEKVGPREPCLGRTGRRGHLPAIDASPTAHSTPPAHPRHGYGGKSAREPVCGVVVRWIDVAGRERRGTGHARRPHASNRVCVPLQLHLGRQQPVLHRDVVQHGRARRSTRGDAVAQRVDEPGGAGRKAVPPRCRPRGKRREGSGIRRGTQRLHWNGAAGVLGSTLNAKQVGGSAGPQPPS